MTKKPLLCRIGIHLGAESVQRGANWYWWCTRCDRRTVSSGRGYTPIDFGWLSTGEWSDPAPPPRNPGK